MKQTVLVTDGEQRAALAAVRSLGRAGHIVQTCSTTGRSLAGASRFSRSDTMVPDPLTDSAGYSSAVSKLVESQRITALIPISEPSLLALLPLKYTHPRLIIPFPELAAFERICDKAVVLEQAATLGIAVPQQTILTRVDDSAANGLSFPVALKPARSVGEHNGRRVKVAVKYASNAAGLQQALREMGAASFPVLAQQRIVGPGIGVFLLRWKGQILAAFAHRRIREKPPSGGVSVYRESTAPDARLLDLSRRLLESFDWSGVAMVEYKVDAVNGMPYLMEINGRFWGSLQLAIDAGVDFPNLLLNAALDAPSPPVLTWNPHVRSRWWWGDVDQLLIRLRYSRARLHLPPDEPGRLGAVARFLLLWRPGDRNEILRMDDPGPFLRETADWFHRR